jgi:hypothetical protein
MPESTPKDPSRESSRPPTPPPSGKSPLDDMDPEYDLGYLAELREQREALRKREEELAPEKPEP